MKTRILFSLSVLFICTNIKSQTFEWLKTVAVDYEYNPDMIKFTTCADPQGGCYFFGIQEHMTFYNQSVGSQFLKKYTIQGDETWSRIIDGQSSASGAVCNSNGDVYIFGQMYTDVNFWGEDSLVKIGAGTDGFLAKVSSDGDLDWSINLSSLPMGEGTVADLVFDSQGWLYVAYSTWMNTYVLIFNDDGEYQQSIIQEDVGIISSLDFDQDGNLLAAGSCARNNSSFGGVPYPAPFSYTTYLVKYNTSFQPVWVKFIEDVTCNFPQVKADENGWIYFAGQLMSETHFDTIAVNGPEWVYDFFLSRLDPAGNFQWVVECPEVLTGDATVGSLQFLDTDADGNALLTGFTRGILDWGNGAVSDVTADYQDIIIWSYAPEGRINWVKTAGGPGYEVSNSLAAGPDGTAYLAGVISGTVVFDTITFESTDFMDPFLARLDLYLLSGTTDNQMPQNVLVYPNPVSDRIFIQSDGYNTYKLFNSTGAFLQSGNLSGIKPEIIVRGLPEGIYLLSLEGDGKAAGLARVIVK
jgi:hypothetical protein